MPLLWPSQESGWLHIVLKSVKCGRIWVSYSQFTLLNVPRDDWKTVGQVGWGVPCLKENDGEKNNDTCSTHCSSMLHWRRSGDLQPPEVQMRFEIRRRSPRQQRVTVKGKWLQWSVWAWIWRKTDIGNLIYAILAVSFQWKSVLYSVSSLTMQSSYAVHLH